MDALAHSLWAGYTQVRDADLAQYFDRRPHANLRAVVAERRVDGGMLPLSQHWLKAPGIGADASGGKKTGGGKATRTGTPPGGVSSPLRANCYRHSLARIGQRQHRKGKRIAPLGRDADDCVVRCRQEVPEPLKGVRHGRERLGLSLNEAQTQGVDATAASVDFWGFALRRSRGLRTGNPSPQVRPANKARRKLKTKLPALTGRELTPMAREKIGGNVNRSLSGWANYCH